MAYQKPTSRQASDPDRPRKGDVTPDSQRRAYEDRGGEVTSIGDEIDKAYEDGRRAGGSSSGPRAAGPVTFSKPGAVPSIAAPMLVEPILVTADEFLNNKRAPVPSRLLVVFGVFGVLGLAKGEAANAAAALGWGLVVATFYSSAGSGGKNGALGALSGIGDFMSGKFGSKIATPATAKG